MISFSSLSRALSLESYFHSMRRRAFFFSLENWLSLSLSILDDDNNRRSTRTKKSSCESWSGASLFFLFSFFDALIKPSSRAATTVHLLSFRSNFGGFRRVISSMHENRKEKNWPRAARSSFQIKNNTVTPPMRSIRSASKVWPIRAS